MTAPQGRRHDAIAFANVRSLARTSARSAPWLGGAEAGRDRVLFAHIRTDPCLAVTSAAAGVVDFGDRIHPHDDVARAARFGLRFARVLALLRRRRGGCRRCERHAPTLGHEYAFGLAARLNGRLVGAPVIIALPGCLLLRDRGWRQSQQSQQCRTHSKGRFHHTSLRENSTQRIRPRGHSAGEKETAALAAAMWSAAPDRQRDYCSLFVLTVSRTKSERVIGKRRRPGAPPSDQL